MSSTGSSRQVSFSSCASNVDDLQRRADDANSAARKAKSAEEEFESKKSDYERCRRDPEAYDIWRDGCRIRYNQAHSAQDEFDDAVSNLESALEDVDSAMRDVESSCGSRRRAVTTIPGVSPTNQRLCASVRRARRTLGAEAAVTLCKQYMPEGECKACVPAP